MCCFMWRLESEEELPSVITEQAISAAIDFVEVCCQHTAYLTGRDKIAEELKVLEAGKN